jgi:hypothetical protein
MQHTPVDRPVAAKPILIEVQGEPLGVVVPSGEAFRFLAVKLPVFSIDGQIFDTVDDARRAADAAINED